MRAQEKGYIVVLASGRPTAGVEPLARELELERFGSYILSYNGGMITNCGTGEIVFSSSSPGRQIKRLLAWPVNTGWTSDDEGEEIITNNRECPYAQIE